MIRFLRVIAIAALLAATALGANAALGLAVARFGMERVASTFLILVAVGIVVLIADGVVSKIDKRGRS